MKRERSPISRTVRAGGAILFLLVAVQIVPAGETDDTVAEQLEKVAAVNAAGPFEADWENLKRHDEAPEWFRDAKFGIYFHWGVYAVPAFGNEWYPRHMHDKKGGARRYFEHHVATHGHPTEFGYDRFVPLFKAEKFDADEWADLFLKAGARYAGPVAEHHDGFAMWHSEVTPWNTGDRGPKRDITGELEKAIRKRGMRFVATFHHARNSLWLENGVWTGHYSHAKTHFPQVLEDPERAILYGFMPRDRFLDMWLAKLVEVIDNYRPDLIWFDSWLDEIPESYRTRYLAYYFNRAKQWNRDVVTTFKGKDLPREIGVQDYEKGRANKLTDFCWLTDDTISKGSWCYTRDLKIKSTNEVLDTLVDIVAKNGCLLLNISPLADGTIPGEQKEVLLGIGKWLDLNGEAIYETRPWLAFGEGPTRLKKGGHFLKSVTYTGHDIRYTRSKDGGTLYAVCLDWPQGPITLNLVKVEKAAPGASVSLLGCEAACAHAINDRKQLVIEPPSLPEARRPCRYAFAFKICGFELSLHEEAPFITGEAITLRADRAVLEGDGLNLEQLTGQEKNIGFWDNPAERVHWLVRIPRAGTYNVRARLAAVQKTGLALSVAGQVVAGEIGATGAWNRAKTFQMGSVVFDRPGVYHLILFPEDPGRWKALNVWSLQLAPAR